jgi:hypothetical protein
MMAALSMISRYYYDEHDGSYEYFPNCCGATKFNIGALLNRGKQVDPAHPERSTFVMEQGKTKFDAETDGEQFSAFILEGCAPMSVYDMVAALGDNSKGVAKLFQKQKEKLKTNKN